ncbi:MAG: prepilin-type N-terminal cleavage/methylation domain-containing protein [Candidatus Wildermuthbacteria bacterium]|nr:prepilin-type N-terminal cleavage/methylation domain-containing protein [Candidatus Wildermuthbacteria bacterium]
MSKTKKGFTLIELLVVIAVIGLLASITLVQLGPVRAKARDAKRMSDIRQITTAQEIYYGTNEGYAAVAIGATNRLTTTAIGTYLDPIPLDPGGGAVADCNTSPAGAYKGFVSADKAAEFCIYSCLEQAVDSKNYFAASEKGTALLAAVPAALACW